MNNEKANIRLCIISYRLDLHLEVASDLNTLFCNNGITGVDTFALEDERDNAKFMYSAGVLILDNNALNEKQIEAANQFSEKKPLFILNIGDKDNKTLEKLKYERVDNLYPYDKRALEPIFQEIYQKYS